MQLLIHYICIYRLPKFLGFDIIVSNMSRSYRKYKGLNHTWSDTKQGKAAKKLSHRQIRAKAKASEDGIELAKKCSRGNCYDGKSFSESEYECSASRRSHGYSPKRVKHCLFGKWLLESLDFDRIASNMSWSLHRNYSLMANSTRFW